MKKVISQLRSVKRYNGDRKKNGRKLIDTKDLFYSLRVQIFSLYRLPGSAGCWVSPSVTLSSPLR